MSHSHRQRLAYLLFLIAISCSTVLGSSLPPGYSLFSNPIDDRNCGDTIGNNDSHWQHLNLSPNVPSVETGLLSLFWTHGLQATISMEYDSWRNTSLTLWNALSVDGTFITMQTSGCVSAAEICKPRYHCWNEAMMNRYSPNEIVYWICLAQYNIKEEEERSSLWRCGIILDSFDNQLPQNCQSYNWDLTQWHWEAADTDQELQGALQGGVDSDGINWVDRRDNATLAEKFGQQFWNEYISCSLGNPCQHKVDCTSVGSFPPNPRRPLSKPYQQAWVYYATSAFVNINQQLQN